MSYFHKRDFFVLLFCILFPIHTQAQKNIAVKTNVPHWATVTPNLGVEVLFKHKMTFELSGGYNPFSFKDGKQWKHWIIWSEIRYWPREVFNGHLIGLHGVFAEFNVTGLELPFNNFEELKNQRYQGDLKGVGLSYGYSWIVGNNLVLEITGGFGYGRLEYDSFSRGKNGHKTGQGGRNYVGPTKGAISLVYLF